MKLHNFVNRRSAQRGPLVVVLLLVFQSLCFVNASQAQLYIDGATLFVQKNGLLVVKGDLQSVKSGSLDPKIANWGEIDVEGEVDLHSSTTYNGQGDLNFTGSSVQKLSANIPLKKINIQNDANVELTSNFNLQGALNLTDGHLICGNYNLTLDDSVTITGGSSSSYIRINGTGKVITKVSSDSVLLPIGRNPYLPIILDDGGGADYTVGIVDDVYANPETSTSIQTADVVSETWTIQASSAQTDVNVILQWSSAEEESGFNRSLAYLSYWEDGVDTKWDIGTATSADGLGPFTLSRKVDFTTNVFYFGVGSDGSALPVELSYFAVAWATAGQYSKDRSALLTWETQSEIDNSHFEIERSLDGQGWEQIGTVAGQGNSIAAHSYQFSDPLEPGIMTEPTIYYRLKQVDYSGQFEYSPVRTLQIEEEGQFSFTVYPNPTRGDHVFLSHKGDYTLSDLSGTFLKQIHNTNQLALYDLAKGCYVISDSQGNTQLLVRQ